MQVDTTTVVTESSSLTLADLAGLDFWLGLGASVLRVAVILGLAIFIIGLVRRLMLRWRAETEALPAIDPRRQRAFTVSNLIMSSTRYVVWTFTTIMVLAAIGLDIGPLIAGAGIAGLAVGFGAQTLVKDVIAGLFLLFDDIIHVGDLITFGSTTGTVEGISLRLVKVRKFDGELVMIPAGELRTFGNKSVGFARVVVPIGVSYEQDLDEILDVMREVAEEWAAVPEHKEVMLEEKPTIQAITDLGESAVTVRIVFQVIPGSQFPAERELRAMIKRRFDAQGIEIPFPRRTVYVRQETELPARSVKAVPEGDGASGENTTTPPATT